MPGDTVTVHAGTYRERITPPRGGESDARRITYRAAAGEVVEIKGSEIVRDWKPYKGPVWKATLASSFFGNYNPYRDLIEGDWFTDKGRPHHTGEVYINGKALFEVHQLEGVLDPKPFAARGPRASLWTWFTSRRLSTPIYATSRQNPNEELVEIHGPRQLLLSHAPGRTHHHPASACAMQQHSGRADGRATGLIGTHWTQRLIIEDNESTTRAVHA
jgi:hypothetical protein